MGATFFSEWQLWQKLVFILGCGIALTIGLGGAKLAHTHRRLRKCSVEAERERKEQALQREMSQKRRGPGVPRADEVPFGVRALERGVEVEGVWISRGNTPEPSIRDELSGSSIWDFMPKKEAAEQDLEKQEQGQNKANVILQRGRAASDSAPSKQTPAISTVERPASAENPTRKPSNHDRRPGTLPAKPAKSQHPPPLFAKYSGNPSLYRQSPSVQTFEGTEAVYRASTYLNPEARHGGSSSESYTQSSSSSSSTGSDPISSAAPGLFGQKRPQTQARPRHHSADFELLNSHRQSQAAETGQLTPRTRKPTQSMDFQVYASEDIQSSELEDPGYFGIKKSVTKAKSTPSSLKKESPSPPKVAALSAAVRRTSLPDVTPFAQFVQRAPSLPRMASPQLRIAEEKAKEIAAHVSDQVSATSELSKLPASSAIATAENAAQSVAGAVRPSFEKERRPSQVLRGHGTGFEILKPGSLPAEMVPAEPEKQNTVPPVSLQSYTRARPRSSSTSSAGRKLQKKRRPSIDQEGLEITRGRMSGGAG